MIQEFQAGGGTMWFLLACAVLGIITMLSALNAYIVGASRVLQNLASTYRLVCFAALSERGTPTASLVATCGISAGLLLFSNRFDTLASASVVANLVPYVAICVVAFARVKVLPARAVALSGAAALPGHLPQGLGRARRRRRGAGGLVVQLLDPVLEPGQLGERRAEPPLLAGERAIHGEGEFFFGFRLIDLSMRRTIDHPIRTSLCDCRAQAIRLSEIRVMLRECNRIVPSRPQPRAQLGAQLAVATRHQYPHAPSA